MVGNSNLSAINQKSESSFHNNSALGKNCSLSLTFCITTIKYIKSNRVKKFRISLSKNLFSIVSEKIEYYNFMAYFCQIIINSFFHQTLFDMQIDTKEHYKYSWQVQKLLADFEVEDVWQFPVVLQEEHTVSFFQAQLFAAMEQLSQKGLAGWLFKLRFFLGNLFGWDKPTETAKNAMKKGSLRERYAQKNNLMESDLIPIGNAEFEPVYVLENESLAEISNETVHAGLHLSKVPLGDKYTIQMAVYVKPKGNFGKLYMALIKPFRLAIVYPAMMKMVGKHWTAFVKNG